jgi:hypothetical protein
VSAGRTKTAHSVAIALANALATHGAHTLQPACWVPPVTLASLVGDCSLYRAVNNRNQAEATGYRHIRSHKPRGSAQELHQWSNLESQASCQFLKRRTKTHNAITDNFFVTV